MKVQQMYSARVKALEEKLTALRKKCVLACRVCDKGVPRLCAVSHTPSRNCLHCLACSSVRRYKGLEKRRNMELEGFTLDVGNMRRQVRADGAPSCARALWLPGCLCCSCSRTLCGTCMAHVLCGTISCVRCRHSSWTQRCWTCRSARCSVGLALVPGTGAAP